MEFAFGLFIIMNFLNNKYYSNSRRILTLIALLLTLFSGGIHAGSANVLRLATTTSTENSGLLEYLLPAFEIRAGYEVQVIAVGTGAALRMGREGDVDVLLVHAPKAEIEFVDTGYGVRRVSVMHNDFVFVGPKQGSEQVLAAKNLTGAMAQIAASPNGFVSRGDDSGTHKKELSLWKTAGLDTEGDWYHESGQGMGKVLQIAGELDAFTLVDRGTWLALQSKSPLRLVFEGDEKLFNPYSIIELSPQRYADLNHQGANALIDWITSAEAQALIGEFKIKGERLFTPDARPAS